MSGQPCPRCGAPGPGAVCSYCGAELLAPGDPRAELAHLDEYHRHVAAAAQGDTRNRLVAEGFLPAGQAALIEAGARCLPQLALTYGESEFWIRRLEAVIAKLRILGDEKGKVAAAELQAQAAAWHARSDSDTRNGLLFFGLLAAAAAGALWWIWRLF